MFGSSSTTSVIPNEEMNDIMNIIKSLEKSDLLIKGVRETIENKAKEGLLIVCYQALQVLVYQGICQVRADKGTNRAGEGTIKAAQHF